jgi:CRISPR system Cascade subunit CasD
MSRRHLILRLEAPLLAFGGEMIDAKGVTQDFPYASMLTGLIANALGWERRDRNRLDALQARLVFAARRDREPLLGRMTDFQTAKLGKNDRGWTTRGEPEGRAGGAGTYMGPHLRYRDYHADALIRAALRLEPAEASPTLDEIAAALDRPARPLFIGRKPCLPSARIFAGWQEGETAGAALEALPVEGDAAEPRALWPEGEGGEALAERRRYVGDQRNWRTDLHGGTRQVCEGRLGPAARHGEEGT